jgi:hypothetical protein
MGWITSGRVDAFDGQSEVDDAYSPVRSHHDVARLDVAVHDSQAMGGRQPQRCLAEHGEDLTDGPVTNLQPRAQGHPLDGFHGQEGFIAACSNVVDRNHMRIRQRRQGTPFGEKPGTARGGHLRAHELERHDAQQSSVMCGEHRAHAPPAELANEGVPPATVVGEMRRLANRPAVVGFRPGLIRGGRYHALLR